jgi:hypothetical protein
MINDICVFSKVDVIGEDYNFDDAVIAMILERNIATSDTSYVSEVTSVMEPNVMAQVIVANPTAWALFKTDIKVERA